MRMTWLSVGDLRSKKLPKEPALDLTLFEKGMALRVLADGKRYQAEVLEVSAARARRAAPIKVRYAGYTAASDEWVGADRVSTKALSKKTGAESKPANKSDERQAVDELVSAGWVIPVETEGALQDHSIAVKDGKILDILPTSEAVKKYRGKSRTNLPNAAIMPGFVNTHSHAPMSFMRGISDDIPLSKWLHTAIWPIEQTLVGPEFVGDGARLAFAEMIMGGTTTTNEMYWCPEDICKAAVEAGIRAAVGMIAIEFPFGGYGTGPDDYLAKGEKMVEKYGKEPLLTFTVSLHAPYTVSDDTIQKGKALCEKYDVPLHIHMHETKEECSDSEKLNKDSNVCHMSTFEGTPLANLRRMGLVTPKLLAVHMTCLTDDEIKWMAEGKANVVHCPSSNLKLASGFCRVGDLLEAGVNVAIGTDGASSNNTVDMMAEMKLAAILAKAVAKNAEAVPADVALRMATLHGARALGLEDRIGSLKVGKEADMIAVDLSGLPLLPAPTSGRRDASFDPVTHIVYSSTRDQVTDVWVRGRRLLRSRKLLTINIAQVRRDAKRWGERITELLAELKRKATEEAAGADKAATGS